MSSSASEQPRGDQVWSSSSPPRSSTPPPQPLVGGLIESLSFRSCGFGRAAVSAFEKEDLRARAALPQRLRAAVHAALRAKDPSAGAFAYVAGNAAARGGRGGGGSGGGREVSAANPWFEVAHDDAPESPLVAFVNPRSGGRLGPVLKTRLQELIGEDQVFDLTVVKPSDFVQYVLGCLEQLADAGDHSAKSIRHNLRVMVAGGDGTVGWVLGCLGDLYVQNREPIPPVAVIPLGTGNDLSRSFGWGASFPFGWKAAAKRSLYKAIFGSVSCLDSWHIVVSMPERGDEEEELDFPHSLRNLGECTFYDDGTAEGELPETVSCFDGVFYNYFSIGMDAQVAYGFHHLRDEKPFLASGPLSNKGFNWDVIGTWCAASDFHMPAVGLAAHDITFFNTYRNSQAINFDLIVRAIVALNLHNYASGRNPWGNLKPEYLEKRGFVEAQSDDGLLEIFGLKQGWHASLVMVELISAKHIAQAAAIRLEIKGGQWRDAYMQMDGEPWKQPLDHEYSTFVDIKKVPYPSLIINGGDR
uniref:Diacylglycerol kinase n=1 Tax=Oryza sativa subsp. japonica TaxID=39947 RepID=Q6YW20_ORYSJ|nr:putative diacylglycerol kinase variant A [Oryza sativa Japonica Group]BAD05846.1 putative diacylglycerol kinase variant A [Oryza sativa Japonica Group]